MENKNYYEILEVDKNASKEVIEKAYKTLAKKYHPDLQEDNNKIDAEEKMKKINEAFEVLFDEEKRKSYDLNLTDEYISKQQYEDLFYENTQLKNDLENKKK